MDYLAHIAVLVAIYVIACRALDVVMGEMGVLSVANGAIAGIGAYTCAIVSMRTGWPIWWCLILAACAAGSSSLLISASALRLTSDGFVIVTFAAQMIITNVLNGWMPVTRGPVGIPNIPPFAIGSFAAVTPPQALAVFLPIAIVSYAVLDTLANRMTLGTALRVIREDVALAASIGVATGRVRRWTFALTAMFTGLSGGLLAVYLSYISPGSFGLGESMFMITIVMVGGADGRWGALIGSILLVGLPEVLRFILKDAASVANLRQILYGLLLVGIVFARPQGLTGRYDFKEP